MIFEIDLCNVFPTEIDVVQTVGGRRAQGNRKTNEGFAYFKQTVVKREAAFGLDFANKITRWIFDWRNYLREDSHTGLIA